MANLPQTEFPFNLPRQSSNFFFIKKDWGKLEQLNKATT
jgi:hypothetical protein